MQPFLISNRRNSRNSGAKYINAPVTPDCESVNLLAQVAHIPTTSIGHTSTGDNSPVDGDVHENEQNAENISDSVVVGNNINGSDTTVVHGNDDNVMPQTNHVQENFGVTGISGTGHTINIYQCPPELINLLVKLLKM
jgi:hypothetical protein